MKKHWKICLTTAFGTLGIIGVLTPAVVFNQKSKESLNSLNVNSDQISLLNNQDDVVFALDSYDLDSDLLDYKSMIINNWTDNSKSLQDTYKSTLKLIANNLPQLLIQNKLRLKDGQTVESAQRAILAKLDKTPQELLTLVTNLFQNKKELNSVSDVNSVLMNNRFNMTYPTVNYPIGYGGGGEPDISNVGSTINDTAFYTRNQLQDQLDYWNSLESDLEITAGVLGVGAGVSAAAAIALSVPTLGISDIVFGTFSAVFTIAAGTIVILSAFVSNEVSSLQKQINLGDYKVSIQNQIKILDDSYNKMKDSRDKLQNYEWLGTGKSVDSLNNAMNKI
ncbi:hypothetical protein [[Mycoplasma] testudinis]|uniref:hypothetical protein n=1 Tax=[Mycoplasma] testudinis TaxID=33924 RepID=UPI0004834EA8|nr:hypothetical protein [[Mycoplasma] testudinis]